VFCLIWMLSIRVLFEQCKGWVEVERVFGFMMGDL